MKINLQLISLYALLGFLGCMPTSNGEGPNFQDQGFSRQNIFPSNSSGQNLSSSSELLTDSVCNRRSTEVKFKFTANDTIALGYQDGSYEKAAISSGSLVVAEGDPCELAQEVIEFEEGDFWNLFLKDPYTGRTGERIKIDVISWNSGVVSGNSSSISSSSSSSLSVSSSSQQSEVAVAGWLTEEIYNQVFPKRNPFYTWLSFKQAFDHLQTVTTLGDFKTFLQEGTIEVKKREAAAFFANIIQETGTQTWDSGLHHIVETCAATGRPTAHCTGYGSSAPNYYYGRGPMQLSWNYNYQAFSQAIFGNSNILYNPNLVSTDPKVAWLAAMWFWNRVDTSYTTPPPTIHDIMVNSASYQGNTLFGGTIKIINGGLECPSSRSTQAKSRILFYQKLQGLFGLPSQTQGLNCF